MANTLDPLLIDRMYAMMLRALRRKMSFLRYVTRKDDELMSSGFKGQNIVIPLAAQFDDAIDVVPSNVPAVQPDITLDVAEVQLTNWKKTGFAMTDLELQYLQAGTFSNHFQGAIDALVRTITKSVTGLYVDLYQHVGAAGVTPFQNSTIDAQLARRTLNNAGCAMEDRSLILNFDADANVIGLPIFQRVNESGRDETLRDAVVTNAIGFNWDTEGYMPSHTRGTLDNDPLIQGVVAAGSTSTIMDFGALTGTVVVGDLFTVAGTDQQFVVTAPATAAGNQITVNFAPATDDGFADDAQVTFVADHDIAGIAMHRQAICFASKPMSDVEFAGGVQIREIPDQETGLVVRLEVSRQYHQTVAEFSCLWGATVARPECGVIILG